MNTLKLGLAVSTIALLSACAGPHGYGPRHTMAAAAGQPPGATPAAAPAAMQERMKAMQAMRDKMMNAKTPEERQALMAEHMKTMHDGMNMMKGMGGMSGMGGMAGMPGMGMGQGMAADPAQRQQMLEQRMDMMQTMMEMMMQRLPGATAPGK